jgi:hypothetical protein
MALVDNIHFLGDRTKELLPDSFLNWSNSTSLKLGLCNFSHNPKYSIVLLLRSQFFITSAGAY